MGSQKKRKPLTIRPTIDGKLEIVEGSAALWPGQQVVLGSYKDKISALYGLRELRSRRQRRLRLLREPNELKQFLGLDCHYVPGHKVRFKHLWTRFERTLTSRHVWTKQKVRKSLPKKYPTGLSTGGQLFVGNLAFSAPDQDEPPGAPLVAVGRKLKRRVDVLEPCC